VAAGFVLVKKVPGTLHFTPRSEHHSFDHNWMNMTHTVNSFYFGALPSPSKYHALKKLHPLGLNSDWWVAFLRSSWARGEGRWCYDGG
jgi:hypothetical protein